VIVWPSSSPGESPPVEFDGLSTKFAFMKRKVQKGAAMKSFDEIWTRAAKRHGGEAALKALLPAPPDDAAVAKLSDDRLLAEMTRKIFQVGFNWSVVDKKWDGFEAAFEGFDVGRASMMSDDDIDRLAKDSRIIRNAKKIVTVRDNAVLLKDLAAEHGSAARAIADWPGEDYVGLLETLKTRGSHLGGLAGQYFLRFSGKDGFILSKDVVAALIDAGVVDKAPTSKKAMRATQDAFNAWRAESGLTLAQLSRVLALSIDA
jgi:3-methyladenine DNA glycosylase Tag